MRTKAGVFPVAGGARWAFLLALALALAGCDLFENGGGKDGTVYVPVETVEETGGPDATGGGGARMAFKETLVTWDTEDAFYKDRYVIVDVENRRILYQESPSNVAQYGEMEVTWDAPPETIPDGFQFTLNYGVAVTKTPSLNAGVGIKPGFSPVWYFEEPGGNPGQVWAGMDANLILVPGASKQITLKASNLPNRIGEEGCFWFNISNATVSYCYVIKG
ncbi:MAG: hypothetical protein FJ109_11730 [Deltaproteobacteria bacterium]|nr:hypothetical protein [Deltaproteobacteria bacterium]